MLPGDQLLAQDPLFSQFFAAPLQLNPAFVGSAFAPRFGAAYRTQWPGFGQAYRTYAAFYEQSIDRLNSGIGFHLEGDDAGQGIYRTTRVAAMYAYRISINRHFDLKLGIEAGAHQTSLNWQKLVFPDQLDPLNGPIVVSEEIQPSDLNRARLDLAAGMLLTSERFWFGMAMKHINTPNETFLLINDNLARGLPIRYTFHGGTEITVKKGNKRSAGAFISPNLLFALQGPYKQLNVGAYLSGGPVFGGGWLRHTFGNADAAILMIGVRQGMFKVALSYDATISGLAARAGGALELTAGVALDQSERLRSRRKKAQINNCLGLFR
jgi:type IX secretion system PorP/SprF family membrane protein